MNYKETLLFIGKCLTLVKEDTHHGAVREIIENDQADWDKIVQVSTEHYIFPMLYVNLKEKDLLKFLPPGLVEFMRDVYMQNLDRNRAILQQAIEINLLLKAHGIPPIFIKGSGLLLDGLYQNLGERMISDINLLIDESNLGRALEILLKNGYQISGSAFGNPLYKKRFSETTCPRLVHEEKIAAVELYFKVVRNDNHFTFAKFVAEQRSTKNGCNVMSPAHQMFLAIMANYHDDFGYKCYATPLRNVYDVYLLSKKINSFDILMDTLEFYEKLNTFLAMAHYITRSSSILYIKSKRNHQFLKKMESLVENPKKYKKKFQFNLFVESIKKHIRQYTNFIGDKNHSKSLWFQVLGAK